ncbi:MAG: Trm112 family protein [Deferribacteraceae bacterium]|nr:Trm112 family protein [Deferribacteraceae bacterium]
MADIGELLQVLVCPKCTGKLTLKENSVICAACKLQYPLDEDIPILLIDQAKPIKSVDSPQN